uniref:Peptidase C48, SUMO/sentrin/Ubl1 n=1 Tax=Tanacetum cinerariifolium TaxID=118510 RepID=A0A6L2MUQ8_TANCI|nr:peptidase C48, SUMO/sentrin/Ubl1 [Tanacetum cinerariifolium]
MMKILNVVKKEQETGTSKKDEAENNKEEGMANKTATNQKTTAEFDPFDDIEFQKYYVENEHLFVPTQPCVEKKKDQADAVNWESFLENDEGSQPTFDLDASPTYEKMKIINEMKKKMGLKSKYVNKTVDPAVQLIEDEKLLGRSIFSIQEEEEEEVFNDDERMILFRMNIQSLAPGLEIDTLVIDAYMKNDVEKMQMEDMELAFFPIIAHGHYYLIVFNLKTGKPVIIDNSESDATYEGKYKDS